MSQFFISDWPMKNETYECPNSLPATVDSCIWVLCRSYTSDTMTASVLNSSYLETGGTIRLYSVYIVFQKLIDSLEVLKIQIYKYIVIENRTAVHRL